MSQTTVNLGHVPVNRGEYSSSATYYKDNIVQYNGSSYICNVTEEDISHPTGISGITPYDSDPASPNTGWAVFANDSSGAGEGVYNVSVDHTTDNQPKIYASLSAALNDIPAAKKKGGMEIRFIFNNSNYAVDKEEGITTQPAGTLITSSPTMVDGTYKASQLLTYFSTLPTATGAGNAVVYYKEVDGTYTTWTITLQSSDNKYVQYRYMCTEITGNPNPFLNLGNWKGEDVYSLYELPYNIINSEIVLAESGVFLSSSLNDRTDYIDISGYNAIKYSRNVVPSDIVTIGIAFYDSEHKYISGQLAKTTELDNYGLEDTITNIPLNAKYVALTIHKTVKNGFYVKGVKIADFLTTNVTFNRIILDEWTNNTIYVVGNQRQHDGHYYRCINNHTSGEIFDTIEQENWVEITDFIEGGGTSIQTINIGTKDAPIYQNLIKITGFGTNSGEAKANNVGDIWYNSTGHVLRIITEITGNLKINKTFPVHKGAIYICNNALYLWNGSDLACCGDDNFNSIKDTVTELCLSHGLEYSVIQNSAVIARTGEFVSSTVNNRTDYIDISEYNAVIKYSRIILTPTATTVGIAFYDSEYNYISGQLADSRQIGHAFYEDTTIRKPINAKYIALTIRKELSGFFVDGTKGLIFDLLSEEDEKIENVYLNQWQYAAKKRFELLAKTVWTPLTGIAPVNSGNPLYPANVKQVGMPYSSTRQIDKYVGYNVSMRTFLTAVHNRYSLLYTENISSQNNISAYGNNYLADQCATYMGVQCATFVNYICGMKVVWLSHQYKYAEKMGYIENLGRPNHNKIRLFDIIHLHGHDMIISDIKYKNNSIVSITVSQATSPGATITDTYYTPQTFDANFYNGTYTLYRISQAYNPSLSVEKVDDISYNDDICTFLGDYACFREGDRIVINYTAGNYTEMELYKENTLVNTLNIDASQHSIDVTSLNLSYGLYKARLTDGTNNSDFTYFEIVDCNVLLTLSEQTKCLIEFSSHNGLPIYVDFCTENGDSVARKQFEPQELLQGFALIDVAVLNSYQPRYSISGCYCKVTFKGEYGEVVNEMIPTGIE